MTYRIAPILIAALFLSACQTGAPRGEQAVDDGEAAAELVAQFDMPNLTLAANEQQLGLAVREIGEQAGGSLALMNGVETEIIRDINYSGAQYRSVVNGIAQRAQCAVQTAPGYFFIYPPGYERLTHISLSGQLPQHYNAITAELAAGSGRPLFELFAWLGHALDVTVVADNEVADARAGELALAEIPLQHVLEAALKSARVAHFYVDSSDEYIFLYSGRQGNRRDMLLNPGALTPEQESMLNRRVDVYLPHPPANPDALEVYDGARPLKDVLGILSQQLGVLVVAQPSQAGRAPGAPGLEDFPVNPAALNNVRVRTALNLLIRQWLTPEYGYQVTHDPIVIRRRSAAEM